MSKIITIYELLGLIKDEKAPNSFKHNGELYIWDEKDKWYFKDNLSNWFCIRHNNLKDKVQILEDEEEFEDIEELKLGNGEYHSKRYKQDVPISMAEEELIMQVNQLIRNQKKIIERLNEK